MPQSAHFFSLRKWGIESALSLSKWVTPSLRLRVLAVKSPLLYNAKNQGLPKTQPEKTGNRTGKTPLLLSASAVKKSQPDRPCGQFPVPEKTGNL